MSRISTSLVFYTFFVIVAVCLTGNAQTGKRNFTEYERLTAKQRSLIDGWAASSGTSGKLKFDSMSLTQHSTFQAITNALSRTKLTDRNGRTIGYAIDLVHALEYPAGQEEGKGSDEQFRLYVKIASDTVDKLEVSREFGRGKDNTVFHHGYPINYRQLGKSPTLQFSITPEKDRADIDVDYRSSGFPAALFNGHLTAGNSDVRVGRNYPTHLTRWTGLIDWWDRDVISVLANLVGINSKAPRPTYVAVSANGSYPDAAAVEASADEFLTTWLVKRDPNKAASFVSPRLAACLDTADRGAETVFRQRRRVLFYAMMQAANKAIGKVDRVEQAVSTLVPLYSSIVPLDHRAKTAYTLAHVPGSYYDHFVCDGTTENWAATDLERDANYGEYYVTMFRFNAKNGLGGGLKLFWVRDGDEWKIITFDVVSV